MVTSIFTSFVCLVLHPSTFTLTSQQQGREVTPRGGGGDKFMTGRGERGDAMGRPYS